VPYVSANYKNLSRWADLLARYGVSRFFGPLVWIQVPGAAMVWCGVGSHEMEADESVHTMGHQIGQAQPMTGSVLEPPRLHPHISRLTPPYLNSCDARGVAGEVGRLPPLSG
jgi:hypothetical protein